MYKVYRNNREQIKYSQLKDIYRGKWLFLVNLTDISYIRDDGDIEYGEPNKCEVFIVADEPYEGRIDGIYDEVFYNRDRYGVISEMDFRVRHIPNVNQIEIWADIEND